VSHAKRRNLAYQRLAEAEHVSLSQRRRKLEHPHLIVHQLDSDLAAEERDWEVEADRLAQKVISIAQSVPPKLRSMRCRSPKCNIKSI
jgi:hypothetical protein